MPFILESREDEKEKPEKYKGEKVPLPEGHVIRISWLADYAKSLLILTIVGLRFYVAVMALLTVVLPCHQRFPTRHLPICVGTKPVTATQLSKWGKENHETRPT